MRCYNNSPQSLCSNHVIGTDSQGVKKFLGRALIQNSGRCMDGLMQTVFWGRGKLSDGSNGVQQICGRNLGAAT